MPAARNAAAADTAAPLLQVEGLTTGYDELAIVKDVSLSIRPGTITAIIGPNGAGKSTVLKAIVGLLPCWKGQVVVGGRDVTREAPHLRVRRGLAFVTQGRVVFPDMTVTENLEMGAFSIRTERRRVAQAMERVLTLYPILAERRDQLSGTLSGGEQQMLAIGRALMTSPDLLLLDEPSLGLSPKFVQTLFDNLRLLRDSGLTIAMVEQKASRALEIADRGYVLNMGQVAFDDAAATLLHDERVKRLFLGIRSDEDGEGAG